ncbi:hypothetical protein SGRIM119S_06264 [Streptomyces griseorubiginosus]
MRTAVVHGCVVAVQAHRRTGQRRAHRTRVGCSGCTASDGTAVPSTVGRSPWMPVALAPLPLPGGRPVGAPTTCGARGMPVTSPRLRHGCGAACFVALMPVPVVRSSLPAFSCRGGREGCRPDPVFSTDLREGDPVGGEPVGGEPCGRAPETTVAGHRCLFPRLGEIYLCQSRHWALPELAFSCLQSPERPGRHELAGSSTGKSAEQISSGSEEGRRTQTPSGSPGPGRTRPGTARPRIGRWSPVTQPRSPHPPSTGLVAETEGRQSTRADRWC